MPSITDGYSLPWGGGSPYDPDRADLTYDSIDHMSLESEESKLRLLKRCTCKFLISRWERSPVVVFASFASFN